MMPVVRISDATLSSLKLISAWYETKTPAETLDRVVSEMMETLGLERDVDEAAVQQGDGPIEFARAPGLSFTRVLYASVSGKVLDSPNWAGLLLQTIQAVKPKVGSAANLVKELQVPSRANHYEDDGFKYHAHLGISVQGQSATDAWKEVDRLARKWRIPVEVRFQWRENPKAQHPGQIGVMRSGA